MATREKDGQNQSESTSRDMWKHGMEAGLAYARLGKISAGVPFVIAKEWQLGVVPKR